MWMNDWRHIIIITIQVFFLIHFLIINSENNFQMIFLQIKMSIEISNNPLFSTIIQTKQSQLQQQSLFCATHHYGYLNNNFNFIRKSRFDWTRNRFFSFHSFNFKDLRNESSKKLIYLNNDAIIWWICIIIIILKQL